MDQNSQATPSTRKQELWRAVKYTLFAASAGIVQVASFALLNEVFMQTEEYGWTYFIALALSVIWNFTFNRRYTFQSATNVPKAMALVLAYYAVFTPLSIWWGDALTAIGWNEYLVLGGTMLVNFITEFLFQRYVVFRNSLNTNDIAKRKEAEAVAEPDAAPDAAPDAELETEPDAEPETVPDAAPDDAADSTRG